MPIAKLKWYAARLAAMSPPEILHRVQEAGRKRAFRSNTKGWDGIEVADGPLADLTFLRARLATGAGLTEAGVAALEQGQYWGLGQCVDAATGPGLWHLDPVSGTPWPGAERYCFDIDVRTTGKARGDVKFVWEINRLQVLHPLAAAIAADPQPGRIDLMFAVLDSWATANPPYRGVNWFSGIELAMRMVTFTLVIAAIPPERMSPAQRLLMRRLVAAHAFWLARYPSKFSSANNHLVAEGLGLVLAGLLAPDLPHAQAHGEEGRLILEQEARLQIFEDGVGGEQSPTYQAFTMEMLAFAALVAGGCGAPLAPVVTGRLMAGARFLQCLMDERGQCPNIGDNDEGRVIGAPPDREPRYVASVVAAVCGLSGDAACLPPDRDAHLRDALFASPTGAARAANGLSLFPVGGYSIIRQDIAGRATVLTFDHGPLGYLKLAAHGHSDALALWLSMDGEPVLVDAGTYLYHSGGALRNRLRASHAHNTLTLNEASQSLPSSAFSWSHRTDGTLIAHDAGEAWRVTASHAGYQKRFGVIHHRTIAQAPSGFSITDQLSGSSARQPVSIAFLLAERIQPMPEPGKLVLMREDRPVAELHIPDQLTAEIVRGARQEGRGVVSNAFGQITDTNQIVLRGHMGAEPVTCRFVILPRP